MCVLYSEMLRAQRCGRGIIVEEGRIGMQVESVGRCMSVSVCVLLCL